MIPTPYLLQALKEEYSFKVNIHFHFFFQNGIISLAFVALGIGHNNAFQSSQDLPHPVQQVG